MINNIFKSRHKMSGEGTILEPLFGEENIQPQNEVEKFADNVVEDLTMLLNPAQVAKTGIPKGFQLVKNIGKSLFANTAGEVVKQTTGNENLGNYTKAGSLFILSLIDQEAAAKQVGKLYTEAEAHLPSQAKINAKGLTKSIDSLEHSITKGRPLENLSPPERFVTNQIEKIRNLISNGEISVEQAVAQKRSLNKELSTLYKEVPKHADQKNVKGLAKQLNKFLNNTIEEYGKTNPKFYKPYKEADQAFGTIARSNFVANWVGDNVTQSPVTHGLLSVFGPATKAAGVALVPYQATKILYRIQQSPVLAKIYQKTVQAAIKEDAILFNKYIKKLDDALQESESEDRFEFIE